MKKSALIFFLAAVIVSISFIIGCSKKKNSSPTGPGQATATAVPTQGTLPPTATVTTKVTMPPTMTITPTATVAPTNTAVIIYAYIDVNDQANGIYADEEIVVRDNSNNPITTAGVTIRDLTTASQINVPYYSSYNEYYIQNPVVNPGDRYEVDVYVNGVTYAAQSVEPGPAQIDADGNTISWQSKCSSDSVTVDNPDGTQAFSRSDSGNDNNPTSINISPVYPASGQYGEYVVNFGLQNSYNESNGAFTGTSLNSSFSLTYNISWDVYVSPGSQSAGTPTATPTPIIQINAYIEGDDGDGGMSASEYVYVYDGNSNAISNAIITIKDLTAATQVNVPNNGGAYYYVQNPAYIPGDKYEVDVLYGGITYTGQSVAEGPAQIDSEGNTVSWQNGGLNNSVSVYNPDGTEAFSQSDSGTDNGQNSIGISSVYAASGQYGEYTVNLSLSSYNYQGNGIFNGASSNSYLAVQYNESWDVYVEPGSQTVSTPSPTPTPFIRINAYIDGNDQDGGMSASEYVYVYDGNNNKITTASVTIKDLTAATQVNAPNNGNSYYVQSPVYTPGDKYEVDVLYGGITYTAQSTAPGPAQIDPEGNTVTWQNSGLNNSVSVENPDSTQAFYQSDSGPDNSAGSADISSVYSKSGQYGIYQVNINLSSYNYENNGAFTGTSSNSYLAVQYNETWDVYVEPGSQTVSTPTLTPTPFVKIYAYITENDQVGSTSTSEYVDVNFMNNTAITTANVTIKDITAASQVNAPYNGGNYTVQNPTYVPGHKYEVDVYYAGFTYTAQSAAPGPAQINSNGSTVSWQNSGNNDSVSVENPDSTQAFYQALSGNDVSQNSMNIAQVYTTSGQYGEYTVNADIENDNYENNGAFAGTSSNSYLYVQYYASWEVFVTSGSKIVCTPTPTPTSTPAATPTP